MHATPLKKLPSPPVSLGVGWMTQLVPFHRSARVVPEFDSPTAVHACGDVQDTACRPPPRGGFGVGWMRHRVPSHRSASVPVTLPALSSRAPTAMQNDGDWHATPLKPPSPPGSLGVGWMRHRVPFHRSARGWKVPELLT